MNSDDRHTRESDVVIGSHWLTTAMSTVGAALMTALLLWIASNQLTIATAQAVLQRDFQAQVRAMEQYNRQDSMGDLEVREWFRQVWPRLRTHGENVAILKRHIEDLCACTVKLKKPDKF